MRLHLCTWPEVEAYLGRSTGIVVPIGSTEQHGPTGPIGTDAICAEAVAVGVGERIGALVAPTIAVGMAVHHMAFPGSMTLKPSTLIAVIGDCVRGLASHGFRRFLLVNGHGGNNASIQAAFYEIHAEEGRDEAGRPFDLRLKSVNWYHGEKVAALGKELFGDDEGDHATPSEIAVVQHLHPQTAGRGESTPQRAPDGDFHGPLDFRRRFPDGRIGSRPALATPAHGARLLATAIEEMVAIYETFLGEE